MAFPIPPDNLTPIPNNPFYYPEGAYLYGPSGPLIVGSGFSINNVTGTINVSGGGSGAPTILAGAGISVVSGVGTVTIANTGIRTVTAGAGIAVSVAGGNLNIVNTLPAPSSFGTVTAITAGTGLTGGTITTSGTIALATTAVAPGTYSNPTITVDSYGRITFASPGSSFGGGITATGPIAVTSTFPQNVSIQAASTAVSGAVQLNDTVTSTSTSQAATANAVKVTYDVASQAQTDATNAANSAATAFVQASSAQALASTANANAASALSTALNAQNDATNALAAAAGAQADATTALATANSANTTANNALTAANNRIPCAAFTGLGQLLVGTGSATFTAFNPGVNGRILAANSACASGLEWVPQTVGTVTNILTGVGLTGGPIVSTGTLAIANTGVVAATYTNPTLAINAQGQITSASNGTAVTAVTGSTPIAVTAGTTPIVSISAATTTNCGAVLLSDSTSSASSTEAATSLAVKTAYDAAIAAIPKACITAKGSLVTGTAASIPVALPVGADGLVLTACAACTEGLFWGAGGGGGGATPATPTVEGIVFGCTDAVNFNYGLGDSIFASLTTGILNVAIGTGSLFNTDSGTSNTAIGIGTLYTNTSGTQNVALGQQALFANTTGGLNVAVGAQALQNATSDGNTALGNYAGNNVTTGTNNIIFGNAGAPAVPVFDVTTEDNRIVMGNVAATNAYIQVAWSAVSDARDKTNVTALPVGLDFVNKLNPVSFQFKESREVDVPHGPVRYGFLAQEVLEAEGENPVIVDTENPEKLKVTNDYMNAVFVKAIQELSAKVEALEAKLAGNG